MFAALSALRESLGSFGFRKGVEVKSSGIFRASFLIIALLYGCGGGDGGGSAMTPPPAPPAVMPTPPPAPPEMMPKAALEPSVQAAQAPLFDFGDNLHIGTGVAPPAGELQKTGERNGVEISKGSVRDGAGATDVIAYLRPSASHSEVTGLATFSRPPVVRVVEGTNEKFTDYAVRAVQIINTALPQDKRHSGLVILPLLIRWMLLTCRVAASISNSFRRPNGRGKSIWAGVRSAMRNPK